MCFQKSQRRVRLARMFEPLRLVRAVLAVVGALQLAMLPLSRSPRIVDEAGVLKVSGKDREAKQSKRRGLCRLGRFGRYLLGSKSQEADKKVSAKLSK